jgi:predicted  nucleic acid-binding Zn-ribbon protein
MTCQKCGKEFPTNNHNGMVKWCPECREDVRRQKENARLRAKREAKKTSKLAASSDERAAGWC